MLETHVLCEGIRAGKGFVAFFSESDDKLHMGEHVDLPGREHMKGFSPVCERMCDMSANREV